jgi:uncharacterized protein YbjT (DUF2867 family)
VVGNAMKQDDLQMLFSDAVSALVVLPDNVTDPDYVANRSEMSRAITQALRDQRVGHIVFASSIGADRDRGVGPIAGIHELEGLLFGLEEANVLSLRAAMHMEQNLLGSIPVIKEQRVNGGLIKGDLSFPMIATIDIAERAAEHLVDRNFVGHAVETILGPEDVTMNQATMALGEALAIPDLPYVEFPEDGVKASLQAAGMSEEFASLLVEMQQAVNEGRMMDEVQRSAETSTPTHIDDFLSTALGPMGTPTPG